MSIVPTISVDGNFAQYQLKYGLIVAVTIVQHNHLIFLVPRSGSINVVRIEWPTILKTEIVDGAIRVTDADSEVSMADLHSHLLSGSIGEVLLTKEELTSRVLAKHRPGHKKSSNEHTVESGKSIRVDELNTDLGLSELWKTKAYRVGLDPPRRSAEFESIKLEAHAISLTDSILQICGTQSEIGRVHISHPRTEKVEFAVGAVNTSCCYFVTGPQRSGTTFLAHAISYDLGIQHIDEVDFQTFDYAQFREVVSRSRAWVAQAPALFHHLSDLRQDFPWAIPVVCRRPISEITASQKRIGWGNREEAIERLHLDIAESDQRPISEIKYEIWDQIKHSYKHFIDIWYCELQEHPLFVETRSEFGPKSWS